MRILVSVTPVRSAPPGAGGAGTGEAEAEPPSSARPPPAPAVTPGEDDGVRPVVPPEPAGDGTAPGGEEEGQGDRRPPGGGDLRRTTCHAALLMDRSAYGRSPAGEGPAEAALPTEDRRGTPHRPEDQADEDGEAGGDRDEQSGRCRY